MFLVRYSKETSLTKRHYPKSAEGNFPHIQLLMMLADQAPLKVCGEKHDKKSFKSFKYIVNEVLHGIKKVNVTNPLPVLIKPLN